MNMFSLSGVVTVGMALFLAGCVPPDGRGGYYGSSSDPYYSGGYYGGSSYDPYYGQYDPYARGGWYDGRSRHDIEEAHAKKHEKLERKYDKAMRRLDRQEREAEEKAYRRYDGNVHDPRYQENQRKIDEKYDHKRGKVERNLGKDHHKYHDKLDRWGHY